MWQTVVIPRQQISGWLPDTYVIYIILLRAICGKYFRDAR